MPALDRGAGYRRSDTVDGAMTEMTQRRLAIELRIAIDRAMRHESPRWVNAVRRLVRDNPHGVASSHVAHNLGAARRAWLARLDTKPEQPLVGDIGFGYRILEEHYESDGTRVIDKAELFSIGDDMVRKHEIPETKKTAEEKVREEIPVKEKPQGGEVKGDAVIRGDARPEKKG